MTHTDGGHWFMVFGNGVKEAEIADAMAYVDSAAFKAAPLPACIWYCMRLAPKRMVPLDGLSTWLMRPAS